MYLKKKILILKGFFIFYFLIGIDLSYAHDKYTVYPIVNIYYENDIISLKGLHNIFTFKKTRWDNGEKIKVVVLPQNTLVSKEFILFFLGYSNTNVYYDILNKVDMDSIVWADSENEVVNYISRNTNYIGYVSGSIIINETLIKNIQVRDDETGHIISISIK